MIQQDIWLVAVTAGKWQRHGIREAKAAGLKVVAIDSDLNAEGFLDADIALNIDLTDHQFVITSLQELNLNICGAVSFVSEAGMLLAARIRERFGLPGLSYEVCKRFVDKGIQRRIWSENGIYTPKWMIFSDKENALLSVLFFNFPFIIKPIDSSGSRGVTKIESTADDIYSAIDNAFGFSRSGKIIIEDFMNGPEFTVEIFAIDGFINVLAVTEKKKVEGTRGTVASELATPDRNLLTISKIKQSVIEAFKALDYKSGPGHAEVILQDDGNVGLIEVAARGGGFMVFEKFVPAVSGINIAKLTAMQAVGIPVKINELEQKFAVLRFFPAKPGRIKEVSGFDEINLIPGVQGESFVKVGDKFNQALTDGDRMGYMLTLADSARKAQDLADKAESGINFLLDNINDY
jgi:biotin carboxylase